MDLTQDLAMLEIHHTRHSLPDPPSMQGWRTTPGSPLETGAHPTLTTTTRRMQAGMNLNG